MAKDRTWHELVDGLCLIGEYKAEEEEECSFSQDADHELWKNMITYASQ